MRNRIVSVVAAAGLLGLIGGTVAANAGTNITSPETITAVGTSTKDKFVDGGKQGPSVGDMFASTLDIKSTAGVDLGTERTQCSLGTGGWAICTGTFDLLEDPGMLFAEVTWVASALAVLYVFD